MVGGEDELELEDEDEDGQEVIGKDVINPQGSPRWGGGDSPRPLPSY
jgi:hypothetical protein